MKTFRVYFMLSVLVMLISSCGNKGNSSSELNIAREDHSASVEVIESDVNSDVMEEFIGSGYFTFDGKEYPLHAGFIDISGEDMSIDNTTEYEISLISTTSGTLVNAENPNNMLNFPLYSKDGSQPKPGHYKFSKSMLDFTNNGMSGFLDPKINDNYLDQGLHTKRGYLEIIQSGVIYELEFEFTNFDDKIIKGFYKGKLL